MSRVVASVLALALLVVGCSRPAVLTREDGAAWDGHLVVGQTVTIGAEIIDHGFAGYHVEPATRLVVEDPTVIALTPDPYGYGVLGLTRGTTTLHVYAGGDSEPADVSITVE